MKLAFTLVARKTLHFAPHHSLRLYIKQRDRIMEESVGEDTFAYHGVLFPDNPAVATGRKSLHRMQPDLTAYQGVPATPITVPEESLGELSLWLDNNAILSQGELQTYYSLVATVDGREIPIPLHTPLLPVQWEGKGLFRIDLSSLELPVGAAT